MVTLELCWGTITNAGYQFKARTPGLLTLACLLVAAPATAQVNYAVSGNTAYVTSSPNASGAIVINSAYNGYSVTSIGDYAFSDCTNLTSVTIPNSVISIGQQAFGNCTALTSVRIPDSATRIGTSLNSAGNAGAFVNCTSLTNVIIGNSVTNIGGAAFFGCTNLPRVTIPNSVTNIGAWAFGQCRSLTNCTFLGNAPRLVFDMEGGGGHFVGVGAGAKVYYYCGTTGWGATYGGLPTVMLCAPFVTTLAADQLTNTSARLRGQVNPRGSGSPTAAWFEWGTATNYGNVIGMQDVGQDSSVSNLNVVLDGLVGGPTYHYRLVATNAFGVVYGADQTFGLSFIPIPISQTGSYGSSAAWGDYDNDGRLDLVIAGCCIGTGGSQLWRNTGSGFSNVTDSVAPGLPRVYQGSVAWGDYDNDGRLDLLLTGSDITQIWRNTGNGFSNVTASVAPGLPGVYAGSVAWGDFDNDGRLDFWITGGGTQLWRNTGSGFSNVTASVAPGLPQAFRGSWGDYDNDGRLDLLLTGGGAGTQLWRNTGSGFSNVTASVAPGLPGAAYGAAWGDYDNDGRLDFLLNGSGLIQLWRNTGSGFSNVTASVAPGLQGVYQSSVTWGDYDNDGRLDFLLTGTPDPEGSPSIMTSQLWRNTGAGFSNVTASVVPGLPGTSSPVAWGDFDHDGRLDFLLTGAGQLWRNNLPIASNAPPATPTGLSSTLSGATVSLSWNPPADDRTPSAGLNYNLRIGTTPGASDVLAPMALTDGLRLLPALGNAQAGTNAVMNLPFGQYYWSVQAVDTSFAGSPFAAEQQFTIAAPRIIEPLMLGNGHFQFSFSNEASVTYAVLGTTNVALPLAQWTVLGPPVSLGGGLYRFTDTGAMGQAQRFYILRAQ